jgi:hypothetical protein
MAFYCLPIGGWRYPYGYPIENRPKGAVGAVFGLVSETFRRVARLSPA